MQSRTCKNWDFSIPEQSRAIPDLQKLGHLQSRSNPEQSRTCKNWDVCKPRTISSNPGLTKIGTSAIPEQSRAIPDLRKLGRLETQNNPEQSRTCKNWDICNQSRSNPEQSRTCKNWDFSIPEQSRAIPDLQKLGRL